MHDSPVTKQSEQSARRVDRLIRSFLGVIDYVASWSEAGRLYRIDILKDDSVADHQLIRNVVSGLGAGCAIRLDRAAVHVHDAPASFAAAAAPQAPTRAAAEPAPARIPPAGDGHAPGQNGGGHAVTGNGHGPSGNGHAPNGNGHAQHGNGRAVNGNGHASHGAGRTADGDGRVTRAVRPPANGGDAPHGARARAAWPPALSNRAQTPALSSGELHLDRIELERHGAALRCRVVLVLDDHIYSAIADVPDSATAEAEVAARVTLDALRAGALTCARLDGVGFTSIADTTFVVAAIRDAGSTTPRASAAPLNESMARAATAAVLNAVGPITTRHREEAELRLDTLLNPNPQPME
jgi:hypothetical protein